MLRRDFIVWILVLLVPPLVVERAQFSVHDWLVAALLPSLDVGSGLGEVSLTWVLGIIVFAAIGALLAAVLRAPRILWWALAFGLVYAAYRFVVYTVHISANAGWLQHVLLLGALFATPALGTVVGALVFRWLRSSPPRMPSNAA